MGQLRITDAGVDARAHGTLELKGLAQLFSKAGAGQQDIDSFAKIILNSQGFSLSKHFCGHFDNDRALDASALSETAPTFYEDMKACLLPWCQTRLSTQGAGASQ